MSVGVFDCGTLKHLEQSVDTCDTRERGALELSSGAGVAGFGSVLFRLLGPISAVLTTRTLGAQVYGGFALASTLWRMMGSLSLLGLDSGVVRYVSLYRSRNDPSRAKGAFVASLSIVLAASCVVAAVLFASSSFIGIEVFHDENVPPALRILLVFLPFLSLRSILGSCLQAVQLIRWQVFITKIISPVVRLVLLALAFALGLGLRAVLIATLIPTVVEMGLSCAVLGRNWRLSEHGVRVAPVYEMGELFGFSYPLALDSGLTMLLAQLQVFALGYFVDSASVGIYRTLTVASSLVAVPLLAFRQILAPMIAYYDGKKDIVNLKGVYKLGARWTLMSSFPVFLSVVLVREPALAAFGPEFVVGANSLILLCLGALVDASVGSVGVMLRMTGRSKIALLDSLVLCILSVALSYLFIPRYQLWGAALAYSVSVTLLNLVKLGQVYCFIHVHPYSADSLKPLVAGGVSFVAVRLARTQTGSGMLETLLIVAAFWCLYVAMVVALGLSDDDKTVLKALRLRLKGRKLVASG